MILRKIIVEENPHARWKHCPKGKTVQEGTGSQDKKGKSQVLRRRISPNHGTKAEQWERPSKGSKKGGNSGKDKSLTILMTGAPLQKSCSFNMFRPEVKSQMVPVTTPLVGFSGEIIWQLGQTSLLVKIGNKENSTSAWMNFMVIRSPSPYNGIIGRPGVRKIQEVQSTSHEMLKFPVIGETVTLRSSKIIPLECTMVSGPGVPQPIINQVIEEKIR
nr:reverse transcriptase domain-containing protein [Tanacetum cinerariifolium]